MSRKTLSFQPSAFSHQASTFLLLTVYWLLAPASPALGQAKESPAIKLTVRPAAAPAPALKYLLLPELRDQTPGNAALLYQRAHSPEWFANIRKWLDEHGVKP